MSRVETLGQALPGLLLEAVRDPVHADRLLLHARKGDKFATLPRVRHNGTTYVPTPLADGLARSVQFPTGSAGFGSDADLIASMGEFLVSHAYLQPETTNLFSCFRIGELVLRHHGRGTHPVPVRTRS